ncbi:subclass B3 metallo-beta-lactamase [Microbulbifer aggregans]|uniref:subclass B3 metallo-beta-lactamase n=1 Tax=Microbulbifer aggregans TaxID=1769779 RepID=UPI001CFE2B31|nr:subclass B3 metallo-beta-lactamase [Microbulbifer aggregans]
MRGKFGLRGLLALCVGGIAAFADAQQAPLPQLQGYEVPESWRTPVEPLQIADHTWQIGTRGLSALLIKSDAGALLIDGGMPQSADHLLANMRKLGVTAGQLKWILHSHAHADHAGPLAAVKHATGAKVVSNAESAHLLANGGAGDIHFGDGPLFPPVTVDRYLLDSEIVKLGDIQLTVHFIPGHTPGSMAWTWRDTRDGREVKIAYVDSLTAPGYQLLENPRYPKILHDFRLSFAKVRDLPCDLLLTPHPAASGWEYGASAVQKEKMDCADYSANAQIQLEKQIEKQRRH